MAKRLAKNAKVEEPKKQAKKEVKRKRKKVEKKREIIVKEWSKEEDSFEKALEDREF